MLVACDIAKAGESIHIYWLRSSGNSRSVPAKD